MGKLESLQEQIEAVFVENLPHILTGLAVVGTVATAVEAYKAAIKIKELDEEESEDDKSSDKAKKVIKAMLPTIILGVLTTGCTISSDVVHTKRYTSLLGAFLLAKTEIPKHKDILKKGKDGSVEVSKDSDKKPAKSSMIDKFPDKKYKVLDLVTNARFESSYSKLVLAELEVTKILAQDEEMTLADFYSLVTDEVEFTGITHHIYWKMDERYPVMDLKIGSDIEPNGEVYLTIDYDYNLKN